LKAELRVKSVVNNFRHDISRIEFIIPEKICRVKLRQFFSLIRTRGRPTLSKKDINSAMKNYLHRLSGDFLDEDMTSSAAS